MHALNSAKMQAILAAEKEDDLPACVSVCKCRGKVKQKKGKGKETAHTSNDDDSEFFSGFDSNTSTDEGDGLDVEITNQEVWFPHKNIMTTPHQVIFCSAH